MIILRQKEFGQRGEMGNEISHIGQVLSRLQPKGWQKTVLYADIKDDNYDIAFYTKLNGKYIKNFDLEKDGKLTRKETMKCFDDIFDTLLPIHKDTGCELFTYTLDNSGHVSMDLDYDYNLKWYELKKQSKYKEDWKKKYLN
jgi:hypothetical protein